MNAPRIFHCQHCKHLGAENTRVIKELRDQMYDRPPTSDALEEDCCPECGSSEYRLTSTCAECLARPADEDGTDYCVSCWPTVRAREEGDAA
jgi:hypothetical protein